MDQNLPLRKFCQKKGSRKFQETFLGIKSVKNGQLYHFLDVRKSQERQAIKKFYNKCSENSRSQIVFRTDIFRKLTLGAPDFSALVRSSSRLVDLSCPTVGHGVSQQYKHFEAVYQKYSKNPQVRTYIFWNQPKQVLI